MPALSYVDSDDLDALIDSNVRLDLFTDDGDVGTEAPVRLLRASQLASTVALSVCMQAGYSPAEATTDDMVKALALSILVRFAYARKTRGVPSDLAALLAPMPEAVRTGELPLVDEVVTNSIEAVGGSSFTGATDTITSGGVTTTITRVPVMRDILSIL